MGVVVSRRRSEATPSSNSFMMLSVSNSSGLWMQRKERGMGQHSSSYPTPSFPRLRISSSLLVVLSALLLLLLLLLPLLGSPLDDAQRKALSFTLNLLVEG